MKLRIFMPTHVFLDTEITKVVAEGENGLFCLLPNHVDFLSALVPGLLSYETPQGDERTLAVNEGILVKCGDEVRVSTLNAVESPSPERLKDLVEKEFVHLSEQEKKARSAIAKLESSLIRHFLEMEKVR